MSFLRNILLEKEENDGHQHVLSNLFGKRTRSRGLKERIVVLEEGQRTFMVLVLAWMAQWEEHRIAKHNWPEWPGFKSHSGHSGVQDKNQGGFTDYFYFKI